MTEDLKELISWSLENLIFWKEGRMSFLHEKLLKILWAIEASGYHWWLALNAKSFHHRLICDGKEHVNESVKGELLND